MVTQIMETTPESRAREFIPFLGYHPEFEVWVAAQRWFYYREKGATIRYPDPEKGEETFIMKIWRVFRFNYRKIYIRKIGPSKYPSVEGEVFDKRIEEFIDLHKNLLAEVELLHRR
jgi:hypothetical protein